MLLRSIGSSKPGTAAHGLGCGGMMPQALRIHAIVSLLVTVAAASQAAAPAPAGGPYALVTTDGTVITDKTYRGKWVVTYFGYTTCPDICPTTLNAIAETLDALGSRAERLQALFVTIDPKRDTPQILDGYVRTFDPRIVALTGTAAQIGAAARAFGVIYERQDNEDGGYSYNHTSAVYLTDPAGKLVETLDGEIDRAKIVGRLSALVQERNDQ
jgi:protein SCO1/2